MNLQIKISKKIFYASGLIAIIGGILSLFYYAYLMPLHVDEAGWWFNYTNKAYQYRFIFNPLDPNHTLTIYLAKISLLVFGNTGIGLRFPVIFFGVLSAGIFFLFVRKVTSSSLTGIVASALLFLNPFFLHYSHELRGYSAYFFLVVCCYLCFIRLLEKGDRFSTWIIFFVLFIACYISNLSAPIFFSIFLATIWIFVIFSKITLIGDRVPGIESIQIKSLFIYSVIVASFFVFIVFYVDRTSTINQFVVHSKESNYLAIPDLFSAFLGYHYLDDAISVLYSYPLIIWLISLSSFIYGWWGFMKNKAWQGSFFLLMFFLTALFYISLQTWVPLRSSVYLLPFIILFQACGLKALIELIIKSFFSSEYREQYSYLSLAGILLCYFTLLSVGKYQNFDPDSDNPYELTRTYLEDNTGLNDLIISSLHDTVGAFYFGDMIREKNFNVYKNGRIENIYYLTPKTGESKIELEMVYPASKKIRLFPLDQFKPIVFFENKGVRPSAVHIFKRKVEIYPVVDLNQSDFLIPGYYGNYKKVCNTQVDGQGIRVKCYGSNMSCANHLLTLSVKKIDLQFILFHHINDRGTKTVSYASMKSMDQSEKSRKENQDFTLLPDVYRFNPLVNNINDLDIHRKKVDLVDVSLQKMGDGKNTLFCMVGSLFEGNSLINGVKVFNWKQ